MLLAWTSTSIAYKPNFWKALTWCFAASSVCNFLSLAFFASDVCADGCEFGPGASNAIVAGCLWIPATAISYMTGPAKPGQTIACSCCPAYEYDEDELGEDGVITEQVLTDGSILTDKTTTYPDGSNTLDTTTRSTKPRILKSSVAEDEKKEDAGGGDEGLDKKTASEV
jgi:hypothetical protein